MEKFVPMLVGALIVTIAAAGVLIWTSLENRAREKVRERSKPWRRRSHPFASLTSSARVRSTDARRSAPTGNGEAR